MTDEEIDAMEAGRELDAIIAEKVMGWTEPWEAKGRLMAYPPVEQAVGIDAERWPVPEYSTDIAAAWLLADKMRLFSVGRRTDGSWQCWHWRGTHEGAHGETAPLAICRAALKAVNALTGESQ